MVPRAPMANGCQVRCLLGWVMTLSAVGIILGVCRTIYHPGKS